MVKASDWRGCEVWGLAAGEVVSLDQLPDMLFAFVCLGNSASCMSENQDDDEVFQIPLNKQFNFSYSDR